MSLTKDLVLLILQFCDEENLKRTAHMLEQETGYFFDLKYFEELVLHGNWEEAEKYLSSFTLVEDNKHSTKIYFEIRKQKFLEALDKHESAVALDILLKDLKVFEQLNKELYKEMTQLLTIGDFREHSLLTSYGDTLSARRNIIYAMRPVLEANPLLQGRTNFPLINKSRLRRLINQSLNWQHMHCAHRHPQPHIDTLFTDHKCPGPDNMQDQLDNKISLVTMSAELLVSGDSKDSHDRSKLNAPKPLDEVMSPADSSSGCQDSAKEVPSGFPKHVEQILNTGSYTISMEFHPVHETLLLVGKSVGDVELWDVSSERKLFKIEFMASEAKSVSGVLLDNTEKNHGISVNRVLWSPEGSLFGVAYSKRLIRLYLYHGNGNYCQKQLEIDAHAGSVNDLAFSKPHGKLILISCGDDKLIQAWDALNGSKQYTFEGHGSPVYSLCSNTRDNIHFLFSTSSSGEIRAWLFDNKGSRITFDAPGFSIMRMAYSADGKRLFSCGTNKNGESYIVELNEGGGSIIRNYRGLKKCSSDMVHFGTSISRFLAAGDDQLIKIWDIEDDEILATIDADGGLPVRPYICFNKKGNLLAVSAGGNEIKILANDEGRELLQTSSYVSDDSSGFLTESFRKLSVNQMHVPLQAARNATSEEALFMLQNISARGTWPNIELMKMQIPHISKVVEVARCHYVLLTSRVKTNTIRRLMYTHSGYGIMALAEDGIHLLWRWAKCDDYIDGEASTMYAPPLFRPKNGLLMINDIPPGNSSSLDAAAAVPSTFTVSKNDAYVISASGGMITLYNAITFKKLRSVMPPPPAATCILFYPPDNNVIAIGLDDSTILIYNIRVDQLMCKLKGHSKRISGLAFSTTLSVLVSCAVDTEIIVWETVTWEKKKSTVLQISVGWLDSADLSETSVQLDKDHNHFLAVHETQLAIYETVTLRRVKQWTIANFCTRIWHATYSCDSELVYAAMRDGILLILDASDLTPRYEIDPSAYLPRRLRCSDVVDPVVVAAHPKKKHQFALGLSNGEIVVIEPVFATEGKRTDLTSSL